MCKAIISCSQKESHSVSARYKSGILFHQPLWLCNFLSFSHFHLLLRVYVPLCIKFCVFIHPADQINSVNTPVSPRFLHLTYTQKKSHNTGWSVPFISMTLPNPSQFPRPLSAVKCVYILKRPQPQRNLGHIHLLK